MRAFFLSLALILVAAGSLWACLVDSGCLDDSDCDAPELCAADRACRLECDEAAGLFCTTDRPICLSPEHRCVACVEEADCAGSGEACVNNQCVPGQAPDFTLADMNPGSPTFGAAVTLSEHRGQEVVLYFAALG